MSACRIRDGSGNENEFSYSVVSMQNFVAVVFSFLAFALLMNSSAVADEQLQLDLRQKVNACQKGFNPKCYSACKSALSAKRRNAPGADEMVAECNREHAKLQATPPNTQPLEDVLKPGYAWMPDVIGTVGSRFKPRMGIALDVPGRADWLSNCEGHAKLQGNIYSEIPDVGRSFTTGRSLRFGKLQYLVGGQSGPIKTVCLAGELEFLN
jgi:hypothetical protein